MIFDSTGLKVFGEGEWKVRKHGYSKRRTWRKVHVGMCADSGQVIVSAVTSNNISDDEAMIHIIGALEETPLGDIFGDGAYDTTNYGYNFVFCEWYYLTIQSLYQTPLSLTCLCMPHLCVVSFVLQELFMAASFDNFALIDN